jgi:hypothetical protein
MKGNMANPRRSAFARFGATSGVICGKKVSALKIDLQAHGQGA